MWWFYTIRNLGKKDDLRHVHLKTRGRSFMYIHIHKYIYLYVYIYILDWLYMICRVCVCVCMYIYITLYYYIQYVWKSYGTKIQDGQHTCSMCGMCVQWMHLYLLISVVYGEPSQTHSHHLERSAPLQHCKTSTRNLKKRLTLSLPTVHWMSRGCRCNPPILDARCCS